jgi:penicillin-binding protein 1C
MFLGFRTRRIKILRITFAVNVVFFFFCLPDQLFDAPLSMVVLDRNDQLLGATIAADGQWRFDQSDSVPYRFKAAIIEFEDRHFEDHIGVHLPSMVRAMRQNIAEQRIVSGGSTISMQVVRLSRNNPSRSILEKITEIIRALRLESTYSKEEILMMYATYAPMGGNVVGLEAASWRYFGRDPHSLSWAEAATLAVLPNAPSLIFPGKNQQRLIEKRNRLLKRLYDKNIIDEVTYTLSIEESVPGKPRPLPQLATHLLEDIRRSADLKRVITTIDFQTQERAIEIVERYHREYEKNLVHNAAALIIEVETGSILSYVGNTKGTDPANGHFVDITNAPRSSGSILKPFLYAAMLHEGQLSPKELVFDTPVNFGGFSPQNFDKSFRGAISADVALARSLNIPAVNMLRKHGIAPFHQRLKKLGFGQLSEASNHYGLSLVLGGGEVTLKELAGAYRYMAKTLIDFQTYNGQYTQEADVTVHPISRNQPTGSLTDHPPIFSAGAIYETFNALESVVRPQSETGWEFLSSARRIAWKTGTSYGFRDAWAVGATPEYIVAVWIGNGDGVGRPGVIGTQAAAPLLFELFDILPETRWFNKPYDDYSESVMCRESGMRASRWCAAVDSIEIPTTCLKSETCGFHKQTFVDRERLHRVDRTCYDEPQETVFFELPNLAAWYYKNHHPEYQQVPPWLDGCEETDSQSNIDILRPLQNSKIRITRDLNGDQQPLVLEAVLRASDGTLHWHIDDVYIGNTHHLHRLQYPIQPGKHTLVVLDEDGNQTIHHFEVLGDR